MVVSDQVDLAFAGISMTPERKKIIDFSHPYLDSGLQILVKANDSLSLDTIISNILSPKLLQILGIGFPILYLLAHIIWHVKRNNNGEIPKTYWAGLWESFRWSFQAFAVQQYGNSGKPGHAVKRLLAMASIMLVIILITQFTASVTASLTINHLAGSISGPSDLPGKKIAAVDRTTSSQYLQEVGINFINIPFVEKAYELLENDRVDAIVLDAPVLLNYVDNEGRGKVEVARSNFRPVTYGIALPP